MLDVKIAIALHVFGVIGWIGGLTFVTLVVLPLLRSGKFGDIQTGFHLIEGRFAPQVKVAVIVVGAAGLWMLYRLNMWVFLYDYHLWPHYWWIPAMILYWSWFVLMLFVLGPSGLLKKIMKGAGQNEAKAWARLHIIHGILMLLGWLIVLGAVFGNHAF